MKRVESAEPKLFELLGASPFGETWDDTLVRIRKQRGHVMAPIRVRVAADLHVQDSTAYPRCLALSYQPKDAFARLCLSADAGLALVAGETIQQATRIHVHPQM